MKIKSDQWLNLVVYNQLLITKENHTKNMVIINKVIIKEVVIIKVAITKDIINIINKVVME